LLLSQDPEARANFEVNYFGVIAVTQKFLPLIRKNSGRLVQISSVAGLISSSGGNPYSTTKYAIESLNDALRLELYPWKVSVSAINPAFVKVRRGDARSYLLSARTFTTQI
jgi:NAD(P)-dependent dehydrogenase (short-subunit alcohol dehydrogenase family)